MNRNAAYDLVNFLQRCLDIGWKKSDLDWLQSLWEDRHDEHGNLIPVVER